MNIRCPVICALVSLAPFANAQVSARSNSGPLPSLTSETRPADGKSRTLTFDMEFADPSGDGFLDAKETGRLRIIISNTGNFPVRNVSVKIVPKTDMRGVTFIDSIQVGDIPVNGTRYAIFYFTAGSAVPSQTVTFRVNILDGLRELVADPRLLTFTTRAVATR